MIERILIIAAVLFGLTVNSQNVPPETWLDQQTKPNFKAGHRLPKLTKYGWPWTFELERQVATNWGFYIVANGTAYLTDSNMLAAAMANTNSVTYKVVTLASNYPSTYQLQLNLERNWPTNMSRGFFVTNSDGLFVDQNTNTWADWTNLTYTKVVSPEADTNDLSIQAKAITGPLKMLAGWATIGAVINGGERDLGVPAMDWNAWKFDPRVQATAVITNPYDYGTNNTGMSWSRYTSAQKARHLRVLTEEIKSSLTNQSPFYVWYNPGYEFYRFNQPGYDWENASAIWGWLSTNLLNQSSNHAVPVANSEVYYISPDSFTNATAATWNNYTDLLTRQLGWSGYVQGLGWRTNYAWVTGGWSNTDTNRLADITRYTGLLKMLVVAGSVGFNVGYYEYPTNTTEGSIFGNGGFGGSFPTNSPPHWLQQLVASSRVWAFATHLDDFLVKSWLDAGNGAHFAATDAASCEFTNTVADKTLRVIARKRDGRSEWLVGAWAAYGDTRDATVNLTGYGPLTVSARPGGSVYWVTPDTVRLLDVNETDPSQGVQVPDVIPSYRRFDWANYTGIPGGIPTITNVFTNMTGLDNTGATDISAALINAITVCPAGQVVYIPAGRYLVTNEVKVTGGKVLRGAGPTNTTLVGNHPAAASASAVVRIGTDFSVSAAWTNAGLALAGQTNLTLLTTNGMAVSNVLAVMQLNDNSTLVYNASQDGSSRAQDYYNSTNYNLCQLIEVLSINGTNITFQPPLAMTFTNSLNCHLVRRGANNWTSYNGIEDLGVEHEDGEVGFQRNFAMGLCKYSWIKNCKGYKCYKYHTYLSAAFRCEVFGCDMSYSAGNSSGGNYAYGVVFASTGNRIWNNISDQTITCVVLGEMTTANVVAYNFGHRNCYSPTNWLQADFAVHDAHPAMNLFEGNVGTMFLADLAHGSGSHQTVFRNSFNAWQAYVDGGTDGTTAQNRGVQVDNWHFSYNVVGNLLGVPNQVYFPWTNGPGSLVNSVTNIAMMFGYTTALPPAYTNAYQATNVYATAIVKDNYLFGTPTPGIPPEHASGGTLPNSLFLTSNPDWMGSLSLPLIGPDVPAMLSRNRDTLIIPAQYRYFGQTIPSGMPNAVHSRLNVGTLRIGN